MANQDYIIVKESTFLSPSLTGPNYFDDSENLRDEGMCFERVCVENEPSFAPWNQLPPEILSKIFSYLDLSDKENVEKTCRSWMQGCRVPSLWREMKFYFSGVGSSELLTQAYRLLDRKGHYLRRLIIKIGLPYLTQAWLMSQCIQHLLEFISHHPSTQKIEHFSLNNLNFSKEWRFFTVSRNNIFRAVNAFLHRQKNLLSIDFSCCRLSAPDGMQLLRSLKYSHCRHTVRHIELHEFFRKSYRAVNGCRFSIILYTSLLALQEIGLDARHMDDKTLKRLTEKSICRKRLRHLKIFFESDRMPRSFISAQSWLEARESCPNLRVSIQVNGRIALGMANNIWSETMPLSHCTLIWSPNKRPRREARGDLALLIRHLGDHYSKSLEGFHLNSSMRSDSELDLAILYVLIRCKYVADIKIVLDNMHEDVAHRITKITTQRPFKVNISLRKRNLFRGTQCTR